MIEWMRELFVYDIPWWLWTAPMAATGLAVFLFVNRSFGFRNALMAAGTFLAAAVVAMSYKRGRQHGWDDRRAKESRDAEELVNRIKRARHTARTRNADPERLRDDDGFKRKS